jgi:hypothetical protein
VSKSTLELINDRERAAIELAEQTRAQISELTERLAALEQQIAHAAIARAVILSLPGDEVEAAARPSTPMELAYQEILAALGDAREPLRARDLCRLLDLPLAPKHIESARYKLKRLVSKGLVTEKEPGLFTRTQA